MKLIFTFLIIFASCILLNAQSPVATVAQVAEQATNSTQQEGEISKIKSSKQYQRKQWYLKRRRNLDGSPANILQNNRQAKELVQKKLTSSSRAPHGNWTFLGPNDTDLGSKQGRVNSIDIHPINRDIIYICTPNGGIWKSTIGGFTWHPLTDHLGLLSFADLEISNSNPDVLYAVSGDGNPAPGATTFHGQGEVYTDGIYKSTNAGNTWSRCDATFPATLVPLKLVMHPNNSNVQFLATNSGIYKTTDGWNTVGTLVHSPLTYDIELHPTNPSIMYASGTNRVWVSNNSGDTWSLSANPNYMMIDTATRVELAVTPDFPNYVAAMAGNWGSGSIALFTSDFSAADNTWILRNSTHNTIGAFAHYCIGLAIDPTDYNQFYGGGVRFHKSYDEGAPGTWSQIGIGVVHADIHDIAIRDHRIYVVSDGGVFRSTDGGSTWLDLSEGLQISEIYRMSGSESDGNLFYIGTQDNGTLRRTAGSTFASVLGSDGMVNIIDYDNNNRVYAMTQNGGFHRSTNGGNSFAFVPTLSDGAWITPLVMDPVDPSILFIGKDSIFRSQTYGTNGSWQYIGEPSTGLTNNLAQGTSNRNRMYATAGSNIYRSDNVLASASAVNWTQVGAGLPSTFITDIAVNPNDSRHVFITMGNYADGLKVYESTSAGDDWTWTNISGSLPNVPVLSIAYHDDGSGKHRVYIGTDIGVFYRDQDIGDWVYFSNYMPSVPVEDLYINNTNNTISAATYGRGLWRSNLIGNCAANKYFSSGTTHTGQFHFSYDNTIQSLATLSNQPNTNITYTAGNIITLSPGFVAPAKAVFRAQIGDCPE